MLLFKTATSHNVQVREAFMSSAGAGAGQLVTVVTADSVLSLDLGRLAILSPLLRQLLAAQPAPCCAEPSLTMADFSSSSILHFMNLISEGFTQSQAGDGDNGDINEIIQVVKTFDLDPSHIAITQQELSNEDIVILDKVLHHQDPSYYCPSDDSEAAVQLPDCTSDPQTQTLVSLDETVPDVSKFEEVESSGSQAGHVSELSRDLTCQLCTHSHPTRSQLLTHYVLNHFMKDLYGELKNYATDKTCNLCGKECKTKQQLCLHLGVKHKKVNSILVRSGLREHAKPALEREEHQQLVIKEEVKTEAVERRTNICQICKKHFDGLGTLWQHYANSHFTKQLREHYSSDMDLELLQCKLCGKTMKQKTGLLVHMGTFHLKVNELLSLNGYDTLEVKESKREKLNNSLVQMN